MRRREFIAVLAGTLISPRLGYGQETKPARVIAVLQGLSASDSDAQRRITTFEGTLRKLGWNIGNNIRMEYRWAAGDADAFGTYATELVKLGPAVMLAAGTAALSQLLDTTRTIPIVFVSVSDPVGLGFVQSLSHPGANVTGFANFESAISGKWLEILKEIAPSVSSAGFVFNPVTAPVSQSLLHSLSIAASSFSVAMTPIPVHDVDEIEHGISSFSREPHRGIIVGPDTFTYVHREQIISLATRYRLPAVYPLRGFSSDGGLVTYGIDQNEQFAQAASYVDLILKGANPGDLPVQAPTKFELVINLKTVRALGLPVPPSLLARADEVIE
jgi:putative ABC transport system substrate-binding protein